MYMCAGPVLRLAGESFVGSANTPGSIRVSSPAVSDGESLCFWRKRDFGEGQPPRTYADFRLGRASIFLVATELWVRHSCATIPLRVSLFLLEIPSAAARTNFS
jgi:hypothetical protein